MSADLLPSAHDLELSHLRDVSQNSHQMFLLRSSNLCTGRGFQINIRIHASCRTVLSSLSIRLLSHMLEGNPGADYHILVLPIHLDAGIIFPHQVHGIF